ncbi:hypothetical protein FBU59_004099 [Linderina macrospora]|uniref:Uncharacterized protein n=1 Tax=Linderina macrospora TaxID=4868 RepID=A0ACC1J6R4_9FUNG|nr:hypothetical protein FBU59_004099 [Linderina macrospora]
MRLLTTVADPDQLAQLISDHGNEDFKTVLQEQFKLSGNLLAAVLYAVARATGPISVHQGCLRVEKYVNSIGRYGRMAFLSSMYGSGAELAQAFCRSCAVAGGTYVLAEPVTQITKTESGYTVELAHGTVRTKSLIMHPSYLPETALSETELPIARRFTVLDSPALGDDTTSMLSFVDGDCVVSMLYLTSSTMVVPSGKALVYAWTRGAYKQVKEVLERAIDCAVGAKARRLMSVGLECRTLAPSGGFTCTPGMPDESVDMDSAVVAAQAILDKFFAGETS